MHCLIFKTSCYTSLLKLAKQLQYKCWCLHKPYPIPQYSNMVCVEAGYVSKPFTLSGGESFVASQSLKIMWQQPVQWCIIELDFMVFTILLQVFLWRCFCSFVLALQCNFVLYLVLCTCISQFTLRFEPSMSPCTCNVSARNVPACMHLAYLPTASLFMCSLVISVLLLSVCQVRITRTIL